jgi:hypothetical protein
MYRYRCTSVSCRADTDMPGQCPACGHPVARVLLKPASVDQAAAAPASSPSVAPPAASARGPRLPGSAQARRSAAWLLYAALAALAVVGSLWQPGPHSLGGLLVAGLVGLYARYLYRGGRVVIVPLPGCLLVVLIVVLAPLPIVLSVIEGRLP